MSIIGYVPPPLTWHIFQIIVNVLSLVISDYVLNQSRGHWLLSDALNAIIIMNLKFKEEFRISSNLQDLIDDDSIVAQELSLFLTLEEKCRNPTLAKCGGEAQHLEKLEVWSPPKLPNV